MVVRSVRFADEICRFKSSVRRSEPVLYYMNKPEVLIIAGGCIPTKGKEVIGSDVLEIFKVERWKIDTEPIIVKLPTQRIAPIILEMRHDKMLNDRDLAHSQHTTSHQPLLHNDRLVILGGHKYAELNGDNVLRYNAYAT